MVFSSLPLMLSSSSPCVIHCEENPLGCSSFLLPSWLEFNYQMFTRSADSYITTGISCACLYACDHLKGRNQHEGCLFWLSSFKVSVFQRRDLYMFVD